MPVEVSDSLRPAPMSEALSGHQYDVVLKACLSFVTQFIVVIQYIWTCGAGMERIVPIV